MKKQLMGYGIAIIAILGLIAFLLPQMLNSVNNSSALSAPMSQQAEAEASISGRAACLGSMIAGIALDCLGGAEQPGELSDLAPTVVNVWAWWCGPCRDELPIVAQFAQDHPEYQVIGVHADPNASNGAAFLDDLGVSLPSFQDDSNAFAGGLGLPGVVPITVVIDHGVQRAMFAKEFSSEDELAQAVAASLASS